MDTTASDNCPRRGKWIRGCRFQPRYDSGKPKGIPEDHLFWYNRSDRVSALRATAPKTYVRDVCVTCGRVIDRSSDAPSPVAKD